MYVKGVEVAVNFNPNIDLKTFGTTKQEPQQQAPVSQTVEPDKFESQQKTAKDKEQVSGFRKGISKIAKFFAAVGEMSKETMKGLAYGTLTAGTFLAGFWSFGSVPRAIKNKSLQALKSISTKGKIISAIAGAGVLAYHIIKGKINTNKKTAEIDHGLKTGHDADKF